MLGVEILLGSRQINCEVLDGEGRIFEKNKTVYDFPALLLIVLLTGLALCLAVVYQVYEVRGWI